MSAAARPPRRRVAVVGAGASGLAAARALCDAGHDVVVLEKEPALGGVWSPTRSYPGLATQNDRWAYAFSDSPVPDDRPEHPTGAQMHEYLAAYAEAHGLRGVVRLGHEVRRARRLPEGWTLAVAGPEGEQELRADALVVANGLYSTARPVPWAGSEAFEAAGGRVAPVSGPHGTAGRRVVVVGWGKTACDLAVALTEEAAAVTIVARRLAWKVPDRIGRDPVHRRFMQTRAGEHLLHPGVPGPRRLLRRSTVLVRRAVAARLGARIVRHHGLRQLGLLPEGRLIAATSKVTDGFYEAVRAGRLRVRRGVGVAALTAAPGVALTDGSALEADVVVPAIGYRAELDLLDPETLAALRDADGGIRVVRRIRAVGVPGLYLAGWTQGPCVPGLLTAEIDALWITADLERTVAARPAEALQQGADGGLAMPLDALADLDARLRDIGGALPRRTRLAQWVRPVRADQYRPGLDAVRRRLAADR